MMVVVRLTFVMMLEEMFWKKCSASSALLVSVTFCKIIHFFFFSAFESTTEKGGYHSKIKQAQLEEHHRVFCTAWQFKRHFIRRGRSVVSITLVEINEQ